MNSKLEAALRLSRMGIRVFPLSPNSKVPQKDFKDFPNQATTDEEQIKVWWSNGHTNANIGISTNGMIALDIDNKGVKKGDEELFRLEIEEGLVFPTTFEQTTPTGGRHLLYRTQVKLKNSVCKLGPGLDTRAERGYIVGGGSVIDGKPYTSNYFEVADAPEDFVLRCGKASEKDENPDHSHLVITESTDLAIERAKHYLENGAPLSLKGEGGDQAAFIVAAKIKDFGVTIDDCLKLMMDSGWWLKSGESWTHEKLLKKVKNAYQYGENPVGIDSPEAQFTKPKEIEKLPPSSIKEVNKDYAFTILGGKSTILFETTDMYGDMTTDFITIEAFKQKLAAQSLQYGERKVPLTQEWLKSKIRRSYKGLCFYPGENVDKSLYNLWRGFSVKPKDVKDPLAIKAFESFLNHIKENVCGSEDILYHWLLNFCAHIIQYPHLKPLVAIVFKGEKGVGKNFFIDQIGNLFKSNYLVTADDRYLTGNFNSHLEKCLLLVLDEAFWSGNKKAEGLTKGLITERHHVIERKGKEAYKTTNFSRICIIGNAEWIVPASNDERRFAVFDVGSGKKQNNSFFASVRKGMEAGGSQLLMKFLTEFKVDKELVNQAPHTQALADQKEESLNPVHAWWLECLTQGEIVGLEFNEGMWPEVVSQNDFWAAFRAYSKERNIRVWTAANSRLGVLLKKCIPALDNSKKMTVLGRQINSYRLPNLEKCKIQWNIWAGVDKKTCSDTISDGISDNFEDLLS